MSHPTGADRLVLCISDIEMGSGGLFEDFPHDAWLAELLGAYNRGVFADLAVDVVFNGDTFDFLKTAVDGAYPVVVDAAVALTKFAGIKAAHEGFFDGVRRFLDHPSAPRRVHFVVGNHDYELVFPKVQAAVREAIGHDGVTFPGFAVTFGDLRVEHGQQDDSMFQVDPDNVLVSHEGRDILVQPWGAEAILGAALPLHHLFYDLDRLKPRKRVFELLPDVRDVVLGSFREYYSRGWFRGIMSGDPNRKITWQMLREVAWRFRTADPNVSEGGSFKRLVMTGPTRCVVVGHVHAAHWWSFADRKVLHTSCFRDEFAIDESGAVVASLPKVYAEVYLLEDRVRRAHLVEQDGPPPPPGQAPVSVFDVLPRVREHQAGKDAVTIHEEE